MTIEEFIDELCAFFTNIRNGDVKGVCDFMDKNKEMVPFDNENGESAAAVALTSRQIVVYEALLSRAWYLNSTEDFNEIVIDFEKDLKNGFCEIHKKLTPNSNEVTLITDPFLDLKKTLSEKTVDSDPLKELLDNYLKIGNDLKFPEIDIHVQRKFLNNKSEKIDTRQILTIAETSKVILLSGGPGMGKTTELKMLAMKFKKKVKSFWVSFVDLKEYSEFYEKDDNFKTNFSSKKETAKFVAQKIFKLNEFDQLIFVHLFCGDRVVLLLDGFDEINSSFKSFVQMLIKSIRTNSENILVISTRPQLKDELCGVLNVEAFTLMPLTKEKCEEILEKNFKKNGIIGEVLNKKKDQTKKFLNNLNTNSELARNPLILRMIAKVFTDDQNSQDMQLNIYSIYENFIKIMILESMDQENDTKLKARNYSMDEFNITRFHHKEAFKELFDIEDERFKQFLELCFHDVQSLADEQITRVGLMKNNGSGQFQFIHRTFAEFFIADFLFKNDEYGETVITYANKNDNPEVLDFYFQSELFPSPYDNFLDTELFVKTEIKLREYIKDDISGFRDELEKIKTCMSSSSIDDYGKLWIFLRRILGENDFKILLSKPNEHGVTPLMSKAANYNAQVFTFFWRLLTEDRTADEAEIFLIDENDDEFNSFDFATMNEDHETFLVVKDLYVKTLGEDKMKTMLTRERRNGGNILFVSAKYDGDNNVATLKALWMFIQEICDESTQKMILMKIDENGDTLYEKLKGREDFNEKMKIFEPFIEKHFNALEKKQFKQGTRRWLKKYFTEKNQNGESVVSLAFKNKRNDAFDHLSEIDLYSMIESQIFRFLYDTEDISSLRIKLERIEGIASGLEWFQRFLNSWTIDGETIYLKVCKCLTSCEDFENLWTLLRRITGEYAFKTLLKKPNRNHGWTPLMFKAWNCSKDVLTSFWSLLTEGLTNEAKEKILIGEDGYGRNTFDYATWNENHETFLAVKDLYVETFGIDKMKTLLTRERNNGESILISPVVWANNNVASMKDLWAFIQEICDVSTQKTILMKTNENGASFYQRLADKADFYEKIEIFEPFIEQHLNALEKVQFKDGTRGWLRHYFTEKNENEESIVSLALKKSSSPYDQLSDIELYLMIESQIFRFLKDEDLSAFQNELKKVEGLILGLEIFQRFLNSWTIEGSTIYLEVCRRLSSIEDYERLWNLLCTILRRNEFTTLLKKPHKERMTPLMCKGLNCNKDVFTYFWILLTEGVTNEAKEKFLFYEDENERNTFDYATWNENHETFLAVKDLYLETLGENKMRLMLTRERNNGKSILLVSITFRNDNVVATIKALWTFIQEICDESTQKAILMKRDKNGETFYRKIENNEKFSMITKIFEPFIEQNLTALEKEQINKRIGKGCLQIFYDFYFSFLNQSSTKKTDQFVKVLFKK